MCWSLLLGTTNNFHDLGFLLIFLSSEDKLRRAGGGKLQLQPVQSSELYWARRGFLPVSEGVWEKEVRWEKGRQLRVYTSWHHSCAFSPDFFPSFFGVETFTNPNKDKPMCWALLLGITNTI